MTDQDDSKPLPGHGLTISEFQRISVERCETWHPISDWSLTDWGCALAGEAGELCNLLKKRRRGDAVSTSDIGRELADVAAYCALLSAALGISLEEWVARKFNEVSVRLGSPFAIPVIPADAIAARDKMWADIYAQSVEETVRQRDEARAQVNKLNPYKDAYATCPDDALGRFLFGIRYYAGMLEDHDNWSHSLGHIQECCTEFQKAIDERSGTLCGIVEPGSGFRACTGRLNHGGIHSWVLDERPTAESTAGASNAVTVAVPPTVRCVRCSGSVERARWCYALPTCYTCLPPPEPIPPLTEADFPKRQEPAVIDGHFAEFGETVEASPGPKCGNKYVFGGVAYYCNENPGHDGPHTDMADESEPADAGVIRAAEGVTLEVGEYEIVDIRDPFPAQQIGMHFTVLGQLRPTIHAGLVWRVESESDRDRTTLVTAVRRVVLAGEPEKALYIPSPDELVRVLEIAPFDTCPEVSLGEVVTVYGARMADPGEADDGGSWLALKISPELGAITYCRVEAAVTEPRRDPEWLRNRLDMATRSVVEERDALRAKVKELEARAEEHAAADGIWQSKMEADAERIRGNLAAAVAESGRRRDGLDIAERQLAARDERITELEQRLARVAELAHDRDGDTLALRSERLGKCASISWDHMEETFSDDPLKRRSTLKWAKLAAQVTKLEEQLADWNLVKDEPAVVGRLAVIKEVARRREIDAATDAAKPPGATIRFWHVKCSLCGNGERGAWVLDSGEWGCLKSAAVCAQCACEHGNDWGEKIPLALIAAAKKNSAATDG